MYKNRGGYRNRKFISPHGASNSSNESEPSQSTSNNSQRGNNRWRPYPRFFNNFQARKVPQQKVITYSISKENEGLSRNKSVEEWLYKLYLNLKEVSSSNDDPNKKKILAFKKYCKQNNGRINLSEVIRFLTLNISLEDLSQDNNFQITWPSFESDLETDAEFTLNCLSLGIHQHLIENWNDVSASLSSSLTQNVTLDGLKTIRIYTRIRDHPNSIDMNSLKANIQGKLITMNGAVGRVDAPQYRCLWLTFECAECHQQQVVRQPNGEYVTPKSCHNGCKKRSNFKAIIGSPYSQVEYVQTVILQDSTHKQTDSRMDSTIKDIEVELTQDLVDKVNPGDDIIVSGILMARYENENDCSGACEIHLRCLSMMNTTSSITDLDVNNTPLEAMDVIQEIKLQGNTFIYLAASLCPTIFGHEMIKAGLLLCLFSGELDEKPNTRSTSHALLVGDPGMGKSELLRACSDLAARGAFVCGNASTTAGLTVSARRNTADNDSVQGGAFVLSDRGTCCIDELDKMNIIQSQSLLEVMEQQTASVTKSGAICVLNARASVIAAANPSQGHYDFNRTVSENLKLLPALLSRFDLIFLVLDRADEVQDKLISNHIRDKNRPQTNSMASLDDPFNDADMTLASKLRTAVAYNIDPIPIEKMKQYIIYAKANIHPVLTAEAKDILKAFYLKMRSDNDGLTVTARQLESLIRLSKARARIDLSDSVTFEHAKDVIELYCYSLWNSTISDRETKPGNSSVRSANVKTKSGQIRTMIQLLQKHYGASNGDTLSKSDLKEMASDAGIATPINDLIEALNNQGYLIKRGGDKFKIIL